MLLFSSIDKQNWSRDLLFSSFRKGFIAFECRLIALAFTRLNDVIFLIFKEQAKDSRIVR